MIAPGNGQDLWILAIHILTLSSMAGAINFIVTIHNMRARGMSWMRLPLFVWSIEIYAAMLLLVLPILSAGLTLLLLERQFPDTFEFFRPENGSPILFQHVFWFFGHPEVYIMILPAMGIVSEILPVFSRKPIFGYKAIAFSTVAIGFFSMLVWAHHMFTVGLATYLNIWFMLASMVIAVPTGVKIFNWLATLWRGNISLDTPMLFALGFVSVFTIGGLSGIYLAAFPFDWQAHDTYFVVAHFHYVLFGGSILAIMGGLWYWWPKIFGRFLSERLGKWTFVLVFVGFNVTFLPQHMLGLLGMPRRVYTYRDDGLWEAYNLVSTIGSYVMGLGMLCFLDRDREEPEGAPGGERPVARRHARVVHDLAAAAAQLRRRAVRHERASALRPAAAPAGGRRPVRTSARTRPAAAADHRGGGRGRRARRAERDARARAGALGRGARRVAAARRGARRVRRRLHPPRVARRRGDRARCCSRSRPAAWSPGPTPSWSVAVHVAAAGAALAAALVTLALSFRGEPTPLGPWRDYVTLTKPRIMSLLLLTGRGRDVRRRGRLAGRRRARRDARRARPGLRRCERAQPRPRSRHRPPDGLAHGGPPRCVRAGAGPARARVRARPLGALVRAPRLDGERPDRAPRPRRQPVLRRRLHGLPQAVDRPEHRDRRRRGRRAARSSATPLRPGASPCPQSGSS